MPTERLLPMAEILNVLKYPDPVLRRGGKDVTEFDDALKATVADMLATMYSYRGVGLAAPQVGLEINLLVLNPEGDPEKTDDELVMINPEIVSRKTLEYGEEGCLSFPSLYAEVERHKKIRVQYQDIEGQSQEVSFSDFLARIVLHEMDHLQGVLFVDRLSATERIRVRNALADMEAAYQAAT
jgi:peptide deformylase